MSFQTAGNIDVHRRQSRRTLFNCRWLVLCPDWPPRSRPPRSCWTRGTRWCRPAPACRRTPAAGCAPGTRTATAANQRGARGHVTSRQPIAAHLRAGVPAPAPAPTPAALLAGHLLGLLGLFLGRLGCFYLDNHQAVNLKVDFGKMMLATA